MKNKKHILLSITGMSPQVVTETLYGIYQNNLANPDNYFWPEEIHIITTGLGKEQATLGLIVPPKLQKRNRLEQFCLDYNCPLPVLKEEYIHIIPDANGNLVDDARTKDDQDALADFIVKAVAQLCDDSNNTIHASIAGGRKTMTFYLGYAMTLFARKNDVLSHVLVDEKYEGLGDFYYPTPKTCPVDGKKANEKFDAKNANVMLAEIPFIRQRELMSKHVLSEFSKTDVLKIKKEDDKKAAAITMSYADLVTYQSISQTLEQLQQRAKIEIVELDKLNKKLSTAQKKYQHLTHDKQLKAEIKVIELQQELDDKEKSLLAINTSITKELALFKLDFDLTHKTVAVRYNNQLCKVLDFSKNELELAYYAMIARNSSYNGLRVDKEIGKEVTKLVFPKDQDQNKKPKHKDIHYGYLFLIELLRIENLSEDKINQIHDKFDREDKANTLDLIKLIYDKYNNYLDPYRKTISSFLDFEISEGHKYNIDKVDVQLVGIDKAFLRDRKKNLNDLITLSLSSEFNDIIAPTGVWQQDQPVSYYRGRSNPDFSDGLWIQSNLTD